MTNSDTLCKKGKANHRRITGYFYKLFSVSIRGQRFLDDVVVD